MPHRHCACDGEARKIAFKAVKAAALKIFKPSLLFRLQQGGFYKQGPLAWRVKINVEREPAQEHEYALKSVGARWNIRVKLVLVFA